MSGIHVDATIGFRAQVLARTDVTAVVAACELMWMWRRRDNEDVERIWLLMIEMFSYLILSLDS